MYIYIYIYNYIYIYIYIYSFFLFEADRLDQGDEQRDRGEHAAHAWGGLSLSLYFSLY